MNREIESLEGPAAALDNRAAVAMQRPADLCSGWFITVRSFRCDDELVLICFDEVFNGSFDDQLQYFILLVHFYLTVNYSFDYLTTI